MSSARGSSPAPLCLAARALSFASAALDSAATPQGRMCSLYREVAPARHGHQAKWRVRESTWYDRLVPRSRPSREQLESELRFLREQVARLEAAATGDARDLAASESDTRRAAILHSALDCIVTADEKGRIVEFNPAAEATFGHAASAVIGRSIGEVLVPHALRPAHEAGFARYLATGHGPVLNQRIEITALRADGREFPVELAITPYIVGGRRYFTAYLRDISARKAAEEAVRASAVALLQAQKLEAIGKLAGGIAHDFNNLLTVIVGYCEILELDSESNLTVRSTAGEIRRAGERAATLTRQLLAFSRQQHMELVPLDLNKVVAETAALLRHLIGTTIDLRLELASEPCRVKADAIQIEQVLINLAVNAKDAMPRGGRITVRTRSTLLGPERSGAALDLPEGHCAMLEVIDTGSGIDPHVRAHMFEPFFTTKGVGQGTGLGLATVYGIVRQSAGAIEVESDLGEGTTLRIYLPATDEPSAPCVERGQSAPSTRGSETILVVEDEDRVRDLVREVLEGQGYRVLEAVHGPAALALERTHARDQLHLLVTDMVMPQMDGPTLALALRAHRAALPVLFMSGHSDTDLRSAATDLPRSSFLQKPFAPAQFARAVREALDWTRRPKSDSLS